jgi:hypothetical protein
MSNEQIAFAIEQLKALKALAAMRAGSASSPRRAGRRPDYMVAAGLLKPSGLEGSLHQPLRQNLKLSM